MIIELIIFCALILYSYFDLKEHAVPSVFTTAVILFLLLVQPQNLIWGVSAFVFGLLLYEFDFLGGRFFGGVADIKVMTIIGLMITSFNQFAIMMLLTTGFSVILSIILFYKNEKEMPKEIPFIPLLFMVYCTLMFLIGMGWI